MPHDATKNPEQVGSVWGQVFLTTAALEKGIKGEKYLLSGTWMSVKDISQLAEKIRQLYVLIVSQKQYIIF